jgi:peptidoglycan-associated lipoprotein
MNKFIDSMLGRRFQGLYMLALAVLLTGCPHRIKTAETPAAPETATAQQEHPPQAAYQIGQEWTKVPEMASVRFDYMKAELKPDARESLKKNAALLKRVMEKNPSMRARVEGNCDQRGTEEYNMALGQRRAEAVRRYYVAMGLSRKTIETISFGKERPVCDESNEACWSQNRRGDTTLNSTSGTVGVSFNDAVSSSK